MISRCRRLISARLGLRGESAACFAGVMRAPLLSAAPISRRDIYSDIKRILALFRRFYSARQRHALVSNKEKLYLGSRDSSAPEWHRRRLSSAMPLASLITMRSSSFTYFVSNGRMIIRLSEHLNALRVSQRTSVRNTTKEILNSDCAYKT